ncbi:MAG: DUF1080 domain-containing protein [Dysgonamonadaceae bacterium]|jgi:hypothetical protein|nr:DUF1080 domain-containing protein [Dysgonamonadaceae bacterium]
MKGINYFLSIMAIAGLSVACQEKEAFVFVAEGECTETVFVTADSLTYIEVNYPQASNWDQAPKDKDGYISLFNGKDFNGWRGYGKDSVPSKWIIEDGAIKINGSGQGEAHTGNGGDIIFVKKFKNFELLFDWKVSANANSGVLYLAREIKGEPIWISSPEYQILDNAGHPDAKLGKDGNRQSASLYDMIPADPQNAKPAGEWNQGGILVYKGTVVHKQNGENVAEYHLWTPKWNELIANSKFKPGGDFPLAYGLLTNLGGDEHEGYIGLQDHGDDVWYKNIRIKILE